MKITDGNWHLIADSVEHKQELFDYAESKGVPIDRESEPHVTPYRDDEDLAIGAWPGSGLLSFPTPDMVDEEITEAQFRAMCDKYTPKAK